MQLRWRFVKGQASMSKFDAKYPLSCESQPRASNRRKQIKYTDSNDYNKSQQMMMLKNNTNETTMIMTKHLHHNKRRRRRRKKMGELIEMSDDETLPEFKNHRSQVKWRPDLVRKQTMSSSFVQSCDLVCRKDSTATPTSSAPCTCQNTTNGHLQIRCARINLAILSHTLKRIQHAENPIERLEITQSTINRLSGPLFVTNEQEHASKSPSEVYPNLHSGSLRELAIRSCALKHIDELALQGELAKNLVSLQLDGNQLGQFPIEQLANLSALRTLNLSDNSISQLQDCNQQHQQIAAAAAAATTTTTTTTTTNQNQLQIKLFNLTELDLSCNKLTRLARQDFQFLYSLEWLDLRSNELAKLDKMAFAFGRKLRQLDLSNNKLLALDRQDFADLTGLEWLSLANNQLSTIPRSLLTKNVKLYQLDLSQNRLEDLDAYLFKSVRSLKRLNVSVNWIKELTKNVFAPTARSIRQIDLAQNQLQAVGPESFKSLLNLELIDLSHNQIVNISSEAFTRIQSRVHIDLSHNKLARISAWAFHELTNITKLNLSHNHLHSDSVSPVAFELVECAQLDLSANLIEDLSRLPISNFTGLRWLDVSHNQISELNKKSFSQRMPLYELQWIDASFNNISQISGNILEKLRSIKWLRLSHNSLRRLAPGALGQSSSLEYLDLSHNNLVELMPGTLSGLLGLRHIDLRFNRMKKMFYQIPSSLQTIHMQFNEIGHLSQQGSSFPIENSLTHLHLDHNRLNQLDRSSFANLIGLTNLTLSNNNLSFIPSQSMRELESLEFLDLAGNSIQSLGSISFPGLSNLRELHLSYNNITWISDYAFDPLTKLERLILSANFLHDLPNLAFSGLSNLKRLHLDNNQLVRFGAGETTTTSASTKSRLSNSDGNQHGLDLPSSLEYLNLSQNRLTTIVTVQTLAHSQQQHSSSSMATINGQLDQLIELDLGNNLISKLETSSFGGLKKLRRLTFRNNIISQIEPNVIGGSSAGSLEELDLSYNKLVALKPKTFFGLTKLTSLLLNNNELSSTFTTSTQAQSYSNYRPIIDEIDAQSLISLQILNVSSNYLDSFESQFMRWIRQGVLVDFRDQKAPLRCSCELLPFVSWLHGVRARNQSNWILNFAQDSAASQIHETTNTIDDATTTTTKTPITNNKKDQFSKLIGQYVNSARLLANISCSEPDSLQGRQLFDLISSMNIRDMNNDCDPSIMLEADSFKRLRAPIQFVNAIQLNDWNLAKAANQNNHSFKISWTLLDSQIELQEFILIRADFHQEPDLSAIRWNLASTSQYGLINLSLDRFGYDQRSHQVIISDYSYNQSMQRSFEMDASHQLVCITYDTGEPSSFGIDLTLRIDLLNQASKLRLSASSQSVTNILDSLINDLTHVNCLDLKSLIQQHDNSAQLIAGYSSSLKPSHLNIISTLLISIIFLFLSRRPPYERGSS